MHSFRQGTQSFSEASHAATVDKHTCNRHASTRQGDAHRGLVLSKNGRIFLYCLTNLVACAVLTGREMYESKLSKWVLGVLCIMIGDRRRLQGH